MSEIPMRPDPSDPKYAGRSLLEMAYLGRTHEHAVATRAVEALRSAAVAMTCSHSPEGVDLAHYCPNCDNSLDRHQEAICAALRDIDASGWVP